MPKLPDWKLERYVLRELPEEELQEIDRRRETDPEFDLEMKQAVAEIEKSNRKILNRYSADEMAAKIRRRAEAADINDTIDTTDTLHTTSEEQGRQRENVESPSENKVWRPVFALPRVVFPAAAAAALALFILFSGQFSYFGLPGLNNGAGGTKGAYESFDSFESGIRLKGMEKMEPGIRVFRRTKDGEAELLKPMDHASEGDLLQLGFVTPRSEYGVLFSVDGRGVVTLHSPPSTDRSAELADEGPVLLESAYRLDDAPRYERFYLVSSDAFLSAGEVMEKVHDCIDSEGGLPASREALKSTKKLSDISEGKVKWYIFTLQK